MSLMPRNFTRFCKFCLVGISGLIVNEGLLFLLTSIAGFFYLISSVIAIEASIVTNFIFHEIWTFNDRRQHGRKNFLKRFVKWNAARLFTALINIIILFILTTLGIHYLISNLIGIAAATLLAYSVSLKYIWK